MKKEEKKRVTLYINSGIYKKYKNHCNKNGWIISKQFQRFIEDELKKEEIKKSYGVKYWLCMTDMPNWNIIKEKNVYGVTDQHKKWIDKLKVKDKVVMHVIRKKIGGLFEVRNKAVTEKINFEGDEHPNIIKLKKLLIPNEFLDLNVEIIRNLELFKNKVSWGPTLMGRSIIEISKEDYGYIKSLMEKVC